MPIQRKPIPSIFFLALILCLDTGLAQTAPAVRDEIDVRLVELDVVVLDREGAPVAGLTRDDFEIREAGRAAPVEHFTAFQPLHAGGEEHPESLPLAGNPRSVELLKPRPVRHVVLFVDRTYLEPGDLRATIGELRSFVREDLDPLDRVMVAATDVGVEVVQGFTTDRELLDRRLAELEPRPMRSSLPAEYRAILEDIERTLRTGGRGQTALARRTRPDILLSRVNAYAEEAHGEVRAVVARLYKLVDALAGVPTRKEVIYVGGRLPSRAGRSLFDAWRSAFGRFSRWWEEDEAAQDVPTEGRSGLDRDFVFDAFPEGAAYLDLSSLFEDLGVHAAAHRVTFHVLDASGLGSSAAAAVSSRGTHLTSQGSGGTWTADSGRRAQSDPAILERLAELTGGRARVRSDAFAESLTGIGRDFAAHYVLGFRPAAEAGAEPRRVDVRLTPRRRGLQVRHRHAYRSPSPDQRAAERILSALLLPAGESPDGEGFPLEVDARDVSPGDDGSRRTRVTVRVPLAELALVPEGVFHVGRLSVFFAWGDLRGDLQPVRKSVVPVRIANDELLTSLGRQVEYDLELPLPDGVHKVAVGVRDDFVPALVLRTVWVEEPRGPDPVEGPKT